LGDLHLNEQFDLAGVSSMASELQRAYHDGLPFPMLRVLEASANRKNKRKINYFFLQYFSLGQDAFSWGHQFRNAGHFAHALLWFISSSTTFTPHHLSGPHLVVGLPSVFSSLWCPIILQKPAFSVAFSP
jgi:hypothetical protein